MAKKEKKPKNSTLTEKERQLVAESSGEKRFKRKDLIVSIIVTVIIVVVLVAGSTVAAMFFGKRLRTSDVYSYSKVTSYLNSHDVEYQAETYETATEDGIIATIAIGDMQIKYIVGGATMTIATNLSSYGDNVKFGDQSASCYEDDARDYIIIGTDTTEYQEYFKEAVE